MEELIKIVFLGQQTTITISQLLAFKPLVKEQTINQIRLPIWMSKFKVELPVLHAALYYVIAIDHSIQQCLMLDFKQRCIASLSAYYISNCMNFQLYEYGYLCSKFLGLSIDKVIHILYFLIYSRLASRPYITNLISQQEKKHMHMRKKTVKSQKDYSIYSKSHDSRHLTMFCESGQYEVDLFKKELKKILCSQNQNKKKLTKTDTNKRYFNVKRIYPEGEQPRLDSETFQKQNQVKSSTSRLISVPLKVGSMQNSSVINRLKFSSGIVRSNDDVRLKKLQVRRQKFNQNYDGCERYAQQLLKSEQKDGRQGKQMQKNIKSSTMSSFRNQKQPFQHFQQIAHNIRSTNQQLDYIRFQCLNHINRMIPSKMGHSKNGDSIHHEKVFNTSNLLIHSSPKNKDEFNGTVLKTQQQSAEETKVKNSQIQVINYERNDQQNGRIKQQQPNKQVGLQSVRGQVSKQLSGGMITRKNDQIGYEQQKLMLFHRKVKNKFKLQKYKQQYRHFLKAQMFQRIRNIS